MSESPIADFRSDRLAMDALLSWMWNHQRKAATSAKSRFILWTAGGPRWGQP